MKTYFLLFAALIATTAQAAPEKAASLCQPAEQTLWNCTARSGKMASLCASKNVTAKEGYVQYRFGTAQKTELVFPEAQQNSQQQFVYTRYTRPMVTNLKVKFSNKQAAYALVSESDDSETPAAHSSSIDVTPASGKAVSIACKQTGSLMKLEDIVPNKDWSE